MFNKNLQRLRRARKTRAKIAEVAAARLTVHRSNSHIYAQVVDPSGAKVLAAASTGLFVAGAEAIYLANAYADA